MYLRWTWWKYKILKSISEDVGMRLGGKEINEKDTAWIKERV